MWDSLWSFATTPVAGAARWLTGGNGGRRSWVTGDRAHIDVREVHHTGAEDVARRIEKYLAQLPGVDWAEVNAALGQVVVGHDSALVSIADLVSTVSEAEQASDADAGQHITAGDALPTNPAQVLTQAVAVGANLAGIGYAAAAPLLRLPRLPAVVPAVVALIDSTPWPREALRSRVGRQAAELVFAVGGAAGNTLAQRPFTLFMDACYRFCLLREAQAAKQRMAAWGAELGASPGSHRSEPVDTGQRPTPLPRGPIERVSDTIAALGLVATVGMYVTGSDARADGFLTAGVPRASHLGREAFAAQLGYELSRRGVTLLDIAATRRMDRIDAAVVDTALLLTGTWTVADVVAVGPDTDVAVLGERAYDLIDPVDPTAPRTRGAWAVAPVAGPAAVPKAHRALVADSHPPGGVLLALARDGRTVAFVAVVPELDPQAAELVAAAADVGLVVLAGPDQSASEQLATRLTACGGAVERVLPGGAELAATVRRLQGEGHGVTVVSADGRAGLAAADVGIGIARGGQPPWGAHVVCGQELGDAAVLLRAMPEARKVSGRCARLAVAGATGAGLLTAWGPVRGSERRAAVPVATSVVFALGTALWSATRAGRRPTPPAQAQAPWHLMPVAAVLRRLDSSHDGLTDADAASREAARAQRTDDAPAGLLHAAVAELANPLTPVLAAGAAVSASVGAVTDAFLIGSVMGVNALIGGAQQVGAERALRRLLDSSAPLVRLRRDARQTAVPGTELVSGDVVELVAGDSVPADCRLLDTVDLEVDESSLTGESQLVTKVAEATGAAAVADRSCMVYRGTVVAAGRGTAVVVATGDNTELGRSAAVGAGTAPRTGGVAARLRLLAKATIPLALAGGVALLGTDLLRGRRAGQALGRAVSLAVAAVPEGLPFVAMAAETAAARRLSRRGALVRNAQTIEALGRADVLCFDKTGTLTEGRISLRVVTDGTTSRGIDDELSERERRVLCAALRASPQPRDGESFPHPTDRAVVAGAEGVGATPDEDEAGWRRVDELPFEPSRGYHAVLGRSTAGPLLSVKGAPEVVLAACSHWRVDDGPTPLDAAARQRLVDGADQLARGGYRVLAVAERPASGRRDLDESRIQGLHLVGLLGLADPVRPTAAAAVAELRRAGVAVVMATGDHPSTAEAIAVELGALNGGRVMTGPELDALGDDQLAAAIGDVTVFARVTPVQKARIVQAWQAGGRVVAVTGDGANDAQAIRLADVGIALGEGAVPAAREAADLVVTDDRIETIVDAIVEGRGMWVSVRDALAILLGGNLGEIGFSVGTGLVGGAETLNARQFLLINLLTDALPAMAVAMRPPPRGAARDLLAEGPEASLGSALTRDIGVRGVVTAGGALAAWFLGRATGTASHANTVALVALVSTQLGQTMAMRGRTPLVVGCGVASMTALAAIVQTPGISHFFGCRPLWPHGWAIALGTAGAATGVAAVLQR